MKKEKAQTILFGACLILTTIFSTVSDAQKNGDATYYCTAEAAGGLAYNKVEKKWKGVGVNTTNKFVLRLKFLREISSNNETNAVYGVVITAAGKNVGSKCISMSGGEAVEVSDLAQVVFCQIFQGLEAYRINLKNNRYLHTVPFGYYTVGTPMPRGEAGAMTLVPSTDEDSDTPYVEGGTCTKIE